MPTEVEENHMVEDLTTEILLRLPVKSLMRFKGICRYWYTLIRSSTFVTKHYHHHSNKSRLLVQHYNDSTETYALAIFEDETLANFPLLYYDIDNVQMPKEPQIFCDYDGIIGFWEWKRIALWNPATREFRFLPMPEPEIPPRFSSFYYKFGFGLDSETNDYKLVWIRTYYYSEEYEDYPYAIIVVYNVSTNSWRLFEADLSQVAYVHDSACSTCLNGIYYWLTSTLGWNDTHDYNLILIFNLNVEVFGVIEGPRDIPESNKGTLIIYWNSISVICFDPREVEKYVDLWVMKEERCWIKEMTIGPLVDISRPLGFWKNGELFLETSTSDLVLYNPNTREIKDLRQRGGPYNTLKIFIYRESLVSLEGRNECRNGDDVWRKARFRDFDPVVVQSDQTAQE